jgi:hypothetical protein
MKLLASNRKIPYRDVQCKFFNFSRIESVYKSLFKFSARDEIYAIRCKLFSRVCRGFFALKRRVDLRIGRFRLQNDKKQREEPARNKKTEAGQKDS